jgi:hypothetical protein
VEALAPELEPATLSSVSTATCNTEPPRSRQYGGVSVHPPARLSRAGYSARTEYGALGCVCFDADSRTLRLPNRGALARTNGARSPPPRASLRPKTRAPARRARPRDPRFCPPPARTAPHVRTPRAPRARGRRAGEARARATAPPACPSPGACPRRGR